MSWTTFCRSSPRSFKTWNGPLQSRSFGHSFSRTFPRLTRFGQEKASSSIPSFRDQLARASEVKPFGDRIKRPTIRNQVLFFVAGSWLVFSVAAAKTHIDTEYWSKRIVIMESVWSRPPTSDEMRRAQYIELGKTLQAKLSGFKDSLADWPIALKSLFISAYVGFAQPYLDAPEGRRMCWWICGLNTVVYLAWKIPRFVPSMNRSFMHHPLSGLSYTLLTSVFSHRSFLHLVANSMALISFGSAATLYLAREQQRGPTGYQESTTKWHFLAFYVAAGLFSGLASHAASTKVLFPRLVSQLSKPISTLAAGTVAKSAAGTTAKEILPSLGASGAIYAAVTLSALAFPDASISLIFLPFFAIPIQSGVGAIIALDAIGILRGWKMFDHYAHLSGATFGVLYYLYGPQWWDFMRIIHDPTEEEKEKSEA